MLQFRQHIDQRRIERRVEPGQIMAIKGRHGFLGEWTKKHGINFM